MSQIFNIGDGKRRQCAMREDFVWFERTRVLAPLPHWSAWSRTPGGHRPAHSWYDPTQGAARLPKDV